MKRELNRRQAREVAVQFLYQIDINELDLEKNLQMLKEERPDLKVDDAFVGEIIRGTYNKREELDNLINGNVIDWKIERMAKVDRNVIRLALYEILEVEDVPVAVAIDEAVELARSFSDEQSAKFVNGILGTIVDALGLDNRE